MEIVEGILMVVAAAACGTLAFYMVKGVFDMLSGKMRK